MTEQTLERTEALRRAESLADSWPLITTYDVGPRMAPDGVTRAEWSIHVRCGRPDCGQSAFSASNASGSYVWSIGEMLRPCVAAHIMQCHREDADE